MDARFDFFNQPAIARNLRQLTSAGHLPDSILSAATGELCRLRASQIAGTTSAPTCTPRTPSPPARTRSG